MNAFRPGDRPTAKQMNSLEDDRVRRLVGGEGIVVRNVGHGQWVVESTMGPLARRRGGGGAGFEMYKVSNYAELVAVENPSAGDLGFTYDLHNFYGCLSGGESPVWQILHKFKTQNPPNGIGENDGDLWETPNGQLKFYTSQSWDNLSHFS
jgi:hypothetical protein